MNQTLSTKALALLQSGTQPIFTWHICSLDFLDDAEINKVDDHAKVDTSVHASCIVAVGDESSEFFRRFMATASLDQNNELLGSFGILDAWQWNEWIELDSQELDVFDHLHDNFANQLIPQWSHLTEDTAQEILQFLQTETEQQPTKANFLYGKS